MELTRSVGWAEDVGSTRAPHLGEGFAAERMPAGVAGGDGRRGAQRGRGAGGGWGYWGCCAFASPTEEAMRLARSFCLMAARASPRQGE